jgi:hypothetical protein
MRYINIFVFYGSILALMIGCRQTDEVNLNSLLHEMVDREQLTRFPDINYKCLQTSSYNRESVSPDKPGWFADSDGTGFIRTEENNGQTEWVIMEDNGPGVITKIWAVCFYYELQDTTGANIKFYLDGADEPVINTNFFALVKGQDFVEPPFAGESIRAGNLYLPIAYAKSCKITMDKKSFYNIVNYRKYSPETRIRTFTMNEFKSTAALREKTGRILADPPEPSGKEIIKRKTLTKGEILQIELPDGPHAIKQIEIKINSADNYLQALRSTVLEGVFDGNATVWCPVGDFFNNVGRTEPYEMWERSVTSDSNMICRWIMPYKKSGMVKFHNMFDQSVDINLRFITGHYCWDNGSMHFYASWRMDPPTPTFPLYDWNFLSARGKGLIVGDQWTVLNPAEGWWGEGDEKIFIDEDIDRNFPSHFGTGTEDYYGWAGGVVPTPGDQFSKPFLGNIIVAHPRSMGYNVCTRTRVLDAIPFRNEIKFDFESSCGIRQRWFYLQYAQTTFWYGQPGVSYNRQPLPEMAAQKLPVLEDLQALVEESKKDIYTVQDAIEAENIGYTKKSGKIVENHADIPVWGEKSNGEIKNLWFEKQGDFVEFKITEQFAESPLKICAAVGPHCGRFEILVNGDHKETQDFYSGHGGMTTPFVSVEDIDPVENAIVIKFVYEGNHPDARPVDNKFALGIDFFLLE